MVNNRYHIAHIIDSLKMAGAEKVAVDIVNRIDPVKFEMHFVATTAEGPRLSQLLPHVKYFFMAKKYRLDFIAMRRLISYLRSNDIILVHTHQQRSACLFSIASRLFGWRCLHVHSDHGANEDHWKEYHKVKRILMKSISLYFPVSHHAAGLERTYLRVPPEKQLVVWNGVETENFVPSKAPGSCEIVQVAGLRPMKHLHVAIDSAKILVSSGRRFQWKVAGPWDNPPSDEQKRLIGRALEAPVSECFKFLGPVSQVPLLLNKSGIGVLTSKAEAMPLALCEYLAAGLPVVVSDIPPHREIIGNKEIGLFARVGDPSDFASKISWLLDNPDAARAMGRRARAFAVRSLDIKNQINVFETTYEDIILRNSRMIG